jgi:hypothetical protein
MVKTARSPLIFLSYSPFDDKHDQRRLTRFAQLLKDEARIQLGESVGVFFDREDLDLGEAWRESLSKRLEQASVFVAIVTPNYFKSRYCRQELERMLDREKRLARTDLIIPVLYLGETGRLRKDELGEKIADRQALDWRGLRFERFDSPRVRRSMSELVGRIGNVIDA